MICSCFYPQSSESDASSNGSMEEKEQEKIEQEDFLCASPSSEHLEQIANTMYEWDGTVAEQLGLKPADVEAIKIMYPGEVKLQK